MGIEKGGRIQRWQEWVGEWMWRVTETEASEMTPSLS